MTHNEEMKLRELAAGKCCLQSVMDAVGPMSLWSRAGLQDAMEKMANVVRAEERERCAKIDSVNNFDNPMTANDCADAIRRLS